MNGVAIPEVKRVVRHGTLSELKKLADEALELGSAREIRALVDSRVPEFEEEDDD